MADAPIPDDAAWERDVGLLLQQPGPLRPRPARDLPPRSGQPWTDAEYEQILDAAREGVTELDEVARRIGRSPHPTMQKARRLLPVAERAAPVDRVMRLLHGHLEEEDYDWRRVTLEEPPPRPVIHAPALTGVAGLEERDLVRVAYALALSCGAAEEDLLSRVTRELQRRGLTADLVRLRAERLLAHGAQITWGQAISEAARWLDDALPSPAGRPYEREYEYGFGPPDW